MSRTRMGLLLFLAAVFIVGILIWQRTIFLFHITLGIGGFILLSLGLIVVVYLFLRLLFRR